VKYSLKELRLLIVAHQCDCRCIDKNGPHAEHCTVSEFDSYTTGPELPPELAMSENGDTKDTIQKLIEYIYGKPTIRKPEVDRLIDYIRDLEFRLNKIYPQHTSENRLAWDGYVNAMLNASPGLSVETAVRHADKILEVRIKKFNGNGNGE
jgi:hypothetical protein